jgi:hypothetical protein
MIAHDSLRIDAFSPQRAERARARLVAVAGPLIVFERIELARAERGAAPCAQGV